MYQTTDYSTKVEDHPKPGNVATLGGLGRVGHHDGTLGTPQQTGAYTKQGAGKSGEAEILRVVVAKIRSNVDRVADAAKGEGGADAKLVGKGAGKEAHDGKG